MNIATGSVINMTPANASWEIAFDLGGKSDIVVCPVIGWATVVSAHMNDGTVHTELKPAFVWGDMVWTETELREHTPNLGRVEVRPYVSASSREWAAAFAHQPEARA